MGYSRVKAMLCISYHTDRETAAKSISENPRSVLVGPLNIYLYKYTNTKYIVQLNIS